MDLKNRIVEFVADAFAHGFAPDAHAWECLESMAGPLNPEDLVAALSDAEWEERETALELLIYPGQETREQAEALLEGAALDSPEVEDIVRELRGRIAEASLIAPGWPEPVRLSVSPNAVEAFARRLNLDAATPKELVQALAACPNKGVIATARALARASRIAWPPPLDKAAARIVKSNHDQEDFGAFFEKALTLLREIPSNRDPEEYLSEKRAWCLFHLDKARSQEQELAGRNMETLLASGVRAVYVDARRLHGQIALIDRILFNMPPLPEFSPALPG